MKFYVEDGDNVYSIQSQLLGNYNFDNAMAAVAVGRFFHVDLWDIKEAIEQYVRNTKRPSAMPSFSIVTMPIPRA